MNTDELTTEYNFTAQEKIIFEWQFRMMGGFEKALMEAIVLADGTNMIKLTKGFPTHVVAVQAWRHSDLVDTMKAKMKKHPEIFKNYTL
jgi:hypothetical protein